MKRFAVIGLGQFGKRLAGDLTKAGQEVIAIDADRQLVEAVRDDVTLAVAMDAKDEHALRAQGVESVDVAVVCMGSDFESNVLTTAVLKQMGVSHVISRATSPTSARVLKQVGADAVINPEEESAERWIGKLLTPFLSRHELSEGISLVELPTPSDWVGKTLVDLKPRSELGVHVVALRRTEELDGQKKTTLHIPQPDQPMKEGEVLLLMGSQEKLQELAQ